MHAHGRPVGGANSMTLRIDALRLFGKQSFSSIYEVNMYESVANDNYEQDIVYVTKYSKRILTSIGIWPNVLQEGRKFLPNTIIGINSLVLLFATMPCSMHIIYEEKNVTMKMKLWGLLSFCFAALFKYWALTIRRSRIRDCIEQVENDWKQVELREDRETMLRYGKLGRNLTIICAVFMYTGGAIYHSILQLAKGTHLDANNRTIKPLVYPSYSGFYDAQKTPVYVLVYTVHCMCGYIIYSITAGACGLAALFATHIYGQIDIVVSRLNDLSAGKTTKGISNVNTRLKSIIEHHIRTLRFSASVETVLQEVCFAEFAVSTFIICLLEYYCITDLRDNNTLSFTTYVMLLISLTFNIFILCYISELLMEKTSNVGILCFMTDWYHLPTKTIQGLIPIIAVSSNPGKLSVGGVIDLSLSAFANVIKTSFAYLNLLRTVTM